MINLIKNRLFVKILMLFKKTYMSKFFGTLLVLSSIISCVLTYSFFAGFFPSKETKYLIILLNIDLVLLVSVLILIIKKIFSVWGERNKNGFGSKLHIRLVILFALVTATPTFLVATFSAVFFNIGLQSWFSKQVQTAVKDSLNVAETYAKEHRQYLAKDILAINSDLLRNWDAISEKSKVINSILAIQAMEKNLDEIVIFNKTGKVIAKTGYVLSLAFEEIPFWALNDADNGGVAIITNQSSDRLRALLRLGVSQDLYILIGKFVSPEIIKHIERAKEAVSKYEFLESKRFEIEVTFYAIFIIIALLLVLVAIWAGINFSIQLTKPIVSLINASEQIREGKTNVKVPELHSGDEIGVLNRTFNRMSHDITTQRADLISKNNKLDARRRFIEAVLKGVSAGVISVDKDNNIKISNFSACTLIEIDLNLFKDQNLSKIVPSFKEVFEEIKNSNSSSVQKYIKLETGKKIKTFTVNLASEYSGEDIYGYVYTFDDITPLQTAQRKAAWSDVARRIAHEIKNPLTPISLSAERLKNKYLKQIENDKETFITCVDTIINQVENIGKMVDEFSAFSRMPNPVMKLVNIKNILIQNMFLHKTANSNIKYEIITSDESVRLKCDESQMNLLFNNIYKNAYEAIIEKQNNNGEIITRLENNENAVIISIEDNGIGLKNQSLDQISEPYYTTKVKGTGLGLAIVKKIIEDHNGIFDIKGLDNNNTLVTITIPHNDNKE
ncbi:MAG: Sensor protein kinase WalK [Alphaproteobacteria bacterium ADurb.Bin438]|nr:MAG: Sensor protein kinase WalK [Alphaproteobacteria bacterium ADurb.Bin438]